MKFEEVLKHLRKNKEDVRYHLYDHLREGAGNFELWVDEFYSLPFDCERTYLMAVLAVSCRAHCSPQAPIEREPGGSIRCSNRFYHWFRYYSEFFVLSAEFEVEVRDYEKLGREAFDLTKELWREGFESSSTKFLSEMDREDVADLANRLNEYRENVIEKMPKYKENFRGEWNYTTE